MVNHWNNNISGWWWLEHEWIMTFPHIGNFIIPTDELIFFQRGMYTTNQKHVHWNMCLFVYKWIRFRNGFGRYWDKNGGFLSHRAFSESSSCHSTIFSVIDTHGDLGKPPILGSPHIWMLDFPKQFLRQEEEYVRVWYQNRLVHDGNFLKLLNMLLSHNMSQSLQ